MYKVFNWDRKDILVFLIGLFSLIKIRVLGTFGISELLCLGLYFFVANPFLWVKHKGVTQFFLVSLLWLAGVFISDRYNDIGTVDSIKGFFNVFFLISLIPFVYWALYDKPHRMLCFWAGNAISALIGFYFQKSINLDEVGAEVWSVYAWHIPFIVLSGLLYYNGKKLLSYIAIEGFAIWSLFHMSRNIFITATLSVVVILFINSFPSNDLQAKISAFKHKSIGLFAVLSIVFFGIFHSYEYLASNKILGERAYTKYYMQKHSRLGLASGRGDFIQSLFLVSKKPLLGYGSYAKNDNRILNKYYESNGMSYDVAKIKDQMLPGHSYLMGGWVYAGILGLAFWIYVVTKVCLFIREGVLYDTKLIGINILLTFSMLWNIFFSPFADRLNFLFFIVLVILTLNSKSNYNEHEY